jgi:hypothetical protein
MHGEATLPQIISMDIWRAGALIVSIDGFGDFSNAARDIGSRAQSISRRRGRIFRPRLAST